MAVLKLKEAGDAHTGKIASAEVTEGNFGPQVCFTFEDGAVLYLPGETAERQLDRIGYTVEELNEQAQQVPVWLKFHRVANTKKGGAPFWNIDKVGKAPQVATKPAQAPRVSQHPSKPVAQPAQSQTSAPDPLAVLYVRCVEYVLDEVSQRIIAAVKTGLVVAPMQAADVMASAATLFIQATKQQGSIFPVTNVAMDVPPPDDGDYPGDDFFGEEGQ